jgi:hypothetical protein
MSTSERAIAVEAAAASLLVIGVVALASPHDVWLRGIGLHPVWLAIIVLSARYATRGLFASLLIAWGGLTAASVALGGSVSGLSVRASGPSDLIALAAAVLVAWIAMIHEGRLARAQTRLAEATEAQRHAEESVAALHESLGYLRSRQDRLDLSLSLWRNLAGRLENGDASEAAKAVLELCEIRAGAQAGIVQLREGNRLSTLARRGQWSPVSVRPMDIGGDATIRAAILARTPTPAGPGATETDSDVAVPVIDEDMGVVVGVIALRGMSPANLRAADLRDLSVLASWIAPALARSLATRISTRRTGELKS